MSTETSAVASRPEWKVILDHLMTQDLNILYRITRKMIIHLERMNISEIYDLIEKINPSIESRHNAQYYGPNWPKPKGTPFFAPEIVNEVFSIADMFISDNEITAIINHWIKYERLGKLARTLEKRHAPLSEVKDALKNYFDLGGSKSFTTENERIGVRVAMIYRLLSENLTYVNVAKHYINLVAFQNILDKVLGPADGNGRIGGKSAGLLLAYQVIEENKKKYEILENVRTPKSWFITSDGLLDFIHYNAIDEFVFTKYQASDEVRQEYPFLEYIFKTSHFPPESKHALSLILDEFQDKPIVVRSSSLLEDSFEASFSGKYKSLFISNNGTREERLSSLMNAISEVYASTFGPDPIEYRKERGLVDFREEMGILVQEVVGNRIGKYYMPSYAGVVFSANEFPWSNRIKREEGIVRIVAGLGTRAVDRTMNDYPILFSPGQPELKVHPAVNDQIRYSQIYVDVINMETNAFETVKFEEIIKESGGIFPAIEHIVSFNRLHMLVDPVTTITDFTKEDLVITFNNLIKKTPFVKQINQIMKILKEAYRSEVDIEFASDGENLYLLQCRPLHESKNNVKINMPSNVLSQHVIFTANKYVTDGFITNIDYVVYVDSLGYSMLETEEKMHMTGKIINRLNRILPKRKFILIGPGRWGSKGDIKLGVPVIYSDINNTAMLIEVAKENSGYVPEVSFGTHFFQDLMEAEIRYLPLYPDSEGVIFNEKFFKNSENYLTELLPDVKEFESLIKVIKISTLKENSTGTVYMDGETGKALACITDIHPTDLNIIQ